MTATPAPDQPIDVTGTASAARRLEIDGLPGHFVLHYQPEVHLISGAITGCEALLRWRHPTFGVLRPAVALENTKWAKALRRAEHWAIDAALQEQAEWFAEGCDLPVAINLSGHQVANPGQADQIEAAMRNAGTDPWQVRVDIPVGVFATYRRSTMELVSVLDDLGVGVVADGVSGEPIEALEGFPITYCKIDLHYQGRPERELHPAVLASIDLAERLDALPIAKAVRSSAELGLLEDAGFDRAFGDALVPDVPGADIPRLVARSLHPSAR